MNLYIEKILNITLLSLSFLLFQCGTTEHSENDHEEDSHQGSVKDDQVHLIKKQMEVMGIKVGKLQEINLSTTIKSNGELELPPQNKASLSAVMAGRVKKITVIEGQYVKKGHILAYLEHPEFLEIQDEYISSLNQLNYQEKELERKRKLYEDSVGSYKSFQLAESKYQNLLSTVNLSRAKLNLIGISASSLKNGKIIESIPVKSPINGYVRLVEVNIGSFVKPEQEMFEIVDNNHIHIDLMVYEKDISKIKEKQKVFFALSTKPDSLFEGKIFAVGKAFEQNPKAVTIHAEIENKSGTLLPGMYVDARIVVDNKKVMALPNEAIVSDAGLNYVFVQKKNTNHSHGKSNDGHSHASDKKEHNDEYIFEKIEVNTGASDIGFTEVVLAQKTSANPTIVTKGAFYLLAEMKKGENGHGHHH